MSEPLAPEEERVANKIWRHYVLVRSDMPLFVQMVQVAHVCREAGHLYHRPDYSHLVLLSVPHEDALLDAGILLMAKDVKHTAFFEPDDNRGWTAICTEPIIGQKRNIFRRWDLWKEPLV